MQKKRGFTLIELLIVILIIGILATIIVINFNAAQARNRDVKRKADLTLIMGALVNYANDKGGVFVVTDGAIKTTDPDSNPLTETIFENAVKGGYLTKIPCDPLGCKASNGTEVGTLNYSGYVYYRGDACGSALIFPACVPVDPDGVKKGYLYASLENPSSDDTATISGSSPALNTYVRNKPVFPTDLSGKKFINYKLSN